MKKIYIITCDSEEKIDLIINQLITPGVAPAGTENTELIDFTDIQDYMPYSNFSIQVEMTSEAADALRQHPLIFSLEEKSDLLAKLHYIGQNRTLTPVYSSLNNFKHDNWGFARCTSLSGIIPFNTNFTHTKTGSGVDVVILDSGIKSDHPEWRDSNGNSRLQQINWTMYNPITAGRTLNVSAAGGAYYINNVIRDTVYVATDKVQTTVQRRTTVYDFVLDGSTASHPFFIGSAVNVAFGPDRVTNNGASTGTVSLTTFPLNNALSVGQSAMYYWCGEHAGMGGVITRTGYNTQADDQYFYSDANGHGTHCTGTVAGSAFGWATDANIYSMHLNFSDSYGFGTGATGLIEAYGLLLNWHNTKMQSVALSSRPTVTNHSYGWDTGTLYSSVNLQVKALTDAKVHFVHSAGNDGAMITVPSDPQFNTIRNGFYCREPSPCYPVDQWTVQANNPVMCIGATGSYSVNGSLTGAPYNYAAFNNETLKAEYSNYGKGVSIYAPGTYINSALPTTATATYLGGALGAYGCGKYSGTSMAGPQVAGILATMLQDMPYITPLSAKQRLIDFSYLGSISATNSFVAYRGTNSYALSGGANAVVSQYPPKQIIVPQTAFNSLAFNGLNYGNSTATVNLSNIILDSTVTAVNSSSNMVYSNNTTATPTPTPTITRTPTPTPTATSTPTPTPVVVDSASFVMGGFAAYPDQRIFNVYANTTTGSAAYVYRDVFDTVTLSGSGVRQAGGATYSTFPSSRIQIYVSNTVTSATTRTAFLTVFSCNAQGQPAGTITYLAPAGLELSFNSNTNNLSSMNLSNCANLQYLVLNNYGQGMSTQLPVVALTGALQNTLRYVEIYNGFNTARLQAANCAALTAVYISSVSTLAGVTLSGCSNLKSLTVFVNNPVLSAIDMTGVGALELVSSGATLTNVPESCKQTLRSVYVPGNLATLSSLCVGVTGLRDLGIVGETTQRSLDSTFASSSALNYLTLDACTQLRQVNINANAALTDMVIIYNAALSAININTVTPSLSYIDGSENNLGALQLDNLYTALPNRISLPAGQIYVGTNPGYGASNTAIATAKNWEAI